MLYQQRSAPPPGGEPDEFVMSDGTIDRMGDVIEPDGWQLDRLKSDPVALFNHDRHTIIGKWTDIAVRKGRLIGRLVWDESGKSPIVEHLRALVKQGILRTVSVGFRPLEKEKLGDKADDYFGPFRFTKSELLECSLVSVPANPNALAIARDLPRDLVAEIFSKPATEDLDRSLAPHGKHAKPLARTGATMTPRAERIQAAQQSLNEMRDRLAQLDDNENRSNAEETEYIELPPKIEATAKSLAAMEAAEKALVTKTGTTLPTRERITVPARPKQTAGNEREYLYRAATALFCAKMQNRTVEDVLRERYPGDDNVGMVIKAAVNPAITTTLAWAGELVGTAIADFLNQLPRSAIYPRISSIGPRFTFGVNGIIKVPARAATPKVNGSFVSEGQPIPVRKMGLTSITLTPKKMAVISTYTREMAEHSTPSIESVIRQGMNDDTAEAIDTALIDNVAADAIRPAGLLNGLTTLTPAATGTQFEKMVADINTLMAPIAAARGGQSLAMLMNIAQINKMSWAVAPNGTFVFTSVENGQVRNLTIVGSTTVPAARVIMLDAAEFASATGDTPNFNVSDVATIHEEDTTPLPLVTGVQGSGVVATPARSLYQTDSIGIRMTLPMNWAMRRAGMVTFMDGVTW